MRSLTHVCGSPPIPSSLKVVFVQFSPDVPISSHLVQLVPRDVFGEVVQYFHPSGNIKMLIWETQAKHGALYVVGKHKLKTSSKHMILHITTSCTAKIQKPGVRYNHIGKLASESTTLTPTLGKPTPKQSMLADIWDPGRPLMAQINQSKLDSY